MFLPFYDDKQIYDDKQQMLELNYNEYYNESPILNRKNINICIKHKLYLLLNLYII